MGLVKCVCNESPVTELESRLGELWSSVTVQGWFNLVGNILDCDGFLDFPIKPFVPHFLESRLNLTLMLSCICDILQKLF